MVPVGCSDVLTPSMLASASLWVNLPARLMKKTDGHFILASVNGRLC